MLEHTKAEDRALKAERKARGPRKAFGPLPSGAAPSKPGAARRGAEKSAAGRGRR
jgi:hypothetical protein